MAKVDNENGQDRLLMRIKLIRKSLILYTHKLAKDCNEICFRFTRFAAGSLKCLLNEYDFQNN